MTLLNETKKDGEILEINFGPQHPSTHGVFRMRVMLEGETVRELKPVMGYLHRNQNRSLKIPLTQGSSDLRIGWTTSTPFQQFSYCLTAENSRPSRSLSAPLTSGYHGRTGEAR